MRIDASIFRGLPLPTYLTVSPSGELGVAIDWEGIRAARLDARIDRCAAEGLLADDAKGKIRRELRLLALQLLRLKRAGVIAPMLYDQIRGVLRGCAHGLRAEAS